MPWRAIAMLTEKQRLRVELQADMKAFKGQVIEVPVGHCRVRYSTRAAKDGRYHWVEDRVDIAEVVDELL